MQTGYPTEIVILAPMLLQRNPLARNPVEWLFRCVKDSLMRDTQLVIPILRDFASLVVIYFPKQVTPFWLLSKLALCSYWLFISSASSDHAGAP